MYGPIINGEHIYYPFAVEQFSCWQEFDECNFFSVNSSWLAIVKGSLRPTDATLWTKITPFQDDDPSRVLLKTDGPSGIVMDGFRCGNGDRNVQFHILDGRRRTNQKPQMPSFEYDGERWFLSSHYHWELDSLNDFKQHLGRIDDAEILLLWSATRKLEHL